MPIYDTNDATGHCIQRKDAHKLEFGADLYSLSPESMTTNDYT